MTLKQRFLILTGFLFVIIGTIGIFLPIIPTTPFLLLAAACFAGNPRLSSWLHKNKLLSDYITNYKERTGLKKRTVFISLTFLWVMLSVSAVWIRAMWAYILFPCIGTTVTVHILYMSLPRKRASEKPAKEKKP